MSHDLNEIALQTDKLDNLIHALELNIPARMHVEILQKILPELRDEIRIALVSETGENPWKTYPEADDDH
jgi:hypothetical protein